MPSEEQNIKDAASARARVRFRGAAEMEGCAGSIEYGAKRPTATLACECAWPKSKRN